MKLIEKVRKAEAALSQAHGEFTLFGLFEREDTPTKWDVVVAAPWLTTDMAGIGQIAEAMVLELAPDDWLEIARIYPLKPTDEFVQSVASLYSAEHSVKEIPKSMINGVAINHAFILAANLNVRAERECPVPQAA